MVVEDSLNVYEAELTGLGKYGAKRRWILGDSQTFGLGDVLDRATIYGSK